MRTSSLEFLSMMTSTLLASWSAGINRLCEVSSANLPALTSPSPTIWHRTLLCAPYKHIRSFRGEARFSTWLYRIAYNCFREDARRRKELVGIDEDQLQAEADPQTVDPGLRHDLMHALSLLPLRERSAVLLCCQNGLSHDEAARVLDIPLGTVKTNVLRGREKLKKMLAAWGPD